MEVCRYMALQKGSDERKQLADEIRKRGNFLCNLEAEESIKPVRRPNIFKPTDASQYLPCQYCYELFKKPYLLQQ